MPLRYGVSPWISQFPAAKRPSFPKYRGEAEADVVIIGGGLTGCATAYATAASGFKPILLEANRVGNGTTAFSMGLLLPDPGPDIRDLVGAHGLRAAKRVFSSWRRGALDAAALLRRLNVRCGLEPIDSLVTAYAESERNLRREYEARLDAGVDVAWLSERHVRAVTRGEEACAMRQTGGFVLDPYRACVGLATAARSRGASLHEASPVRKVRVGRKNVEVVTEHGVLRAATVIVATGRPTPLFGPLRRHFATHDSYRVLTDVLPPRVRRQVGVPGATLRDSHQPPHRLRWTEDHRALIGGAEQPEAPVRKREALVRQWTFELMYEFLKMYPAIAGLQPGYGWSVSSALSRDRLPYIGAHRNYPRHLFAFGDTDSLTGSFLAARILTRALEGTPDAADEAFGFTR